MREEEGKKVDTTNKENAHVNQCLRETFSRQFSFALPGPGLLVAAVTRVRGLTRRTHSSQSSLSRALTLTRLTSRNKFQRIKWKENSHACQENIKEPF